MRRGATVASGCKPGAVLRILLLILLPGLLAARFAFAMETLARTLDPFEDVSPWRASASDDVRARLQSVPGSSGNALCLEFDFGRVSGYAVARRELPLELGGNYEIAFKVKGDAAPNTLQVKLVDASGENVWWVNRPDFEFPGDWQTLRFKRRHIGFAWGPTQDRVLKRSAALEFVIVRGSGGGKGSVCFDELTLRPLPAVTPPAAPRITASSALAPSSPAHALDGTLDTVWWSDPAEPGDQTLTLDFGAPREFGGLILHWAADAHARRYVIEYSEDGARWQTIREVVAGNGGKDWHLLSESETRYLRLRLKEGTGRGYGLAEIEIKDVDWGASPNAFFEALAKAAPRGHYPRAYAGEQTYWTVLGIDGGRHHGLLSEDGALEALPRAPAIEPFLMLDGKVLTWADQKAEHALREGYLPIPRVSWNGRDWALHVTAFAAGNEERAQLVARYRLENRGDRTRHMTLALAVRPFQVNPPQQFLNVAGGVAPVRALEWDGRALAVNGALRVYPLDKPHQVILAPYDAGNVPELLVASISQARKSLRDETGFASGMLVYRIEVPARGHREVGIVVPWGEAAALPHSVDAAAWLARAEEAVAREWRGKLNRVTLRLPREARHVAHTVRTALAHVLASRNGAALQPGTRAYARSWIRDGAMMSEGLSRMDHAAVAREYAEWFAPHQFTNGKVPCCVDHRGSDPVAENDSHGAFIHLIAQHYRYTRDKAWLETMSPRVEAAARYMDALRLSERTARNLDPARRAFYGLMPPSISHEGYSDKPAYSYWDDFWTLAGYDGALEIARGLGHDADVERLATQRAEFHRDLLASLRESLARHGIDYIPGAADRGDYDPTSTTIALSIAGLQAALPERALHATFERYWREFLARRDRSDWSDYTPYELRNVGAFVRLGWRERVMTLLDFFHGDRRPAPWNQWAEVVGREARAPRFIGDMPHGWVASDYLSAVLDLLAYERPADRSLVIGAGIPERWLAGEGVGVENLQTPHGALTYRLRREGGALALDVGGDAMPEGGLIFRWPYSGRPGRATLDGRPLDWERDRELRIRALPARVRIDIHRD